jgi:ppGpp synthetase/RelA/SpoT-type nucleotidyltranferase
MANALREEERRWAEEQLDEYRRRLPAYERYAVALKDLLVAAASGLAPLAVVESRAKSIASFGQKIWRRRDVCDDPVEQFTDLCGARVITQTAAEVEAVSDWIEDQFEIDWDNTVDKRQRLRPTEFGYRSVHYVVVLEPRSLPNPRAEIQVRTLLEHAWANASHELVYKRSAPVPASLHRELAAVAAVLESADAAFARVQRELVGYAAGDAAHLSPAEMRRELERLRLVLERDRDNADLAGRVGVLANLLRDWELTEAELDHLAGTENLSVLRALGEAKCRGHAAGSPQHAQGRRLLERASRRPDRDVETLISYGDTFADRSEAGEWYRRAFELDPSDPRGVARHLEHEIVELRNTSIVRTLGPVVDAAIRRCRTQAAVGLALPATFYDIGRFCLLRGDLYGSLAAYGKALQMTDDPSRTSEALASLERLRVPGIHLPGFDCVTRLLLVGLAAWRLGPSRAVAEVERAFEDVCALATGPVHGAEAPVVILAGGASSEAASHMEGYRELLLAAFRYFEGTIVSGGTTQGIGGLAGDVRAEYGARIRTLGYIPKRIPSDAVVDRDRERYDELRVTEGESFSPLQPIQNWIDLVASGVHPAEVKLLAIGGGPVTGGELRVALGLGASVAVIEMSGGATAQLLEDEDWAGAAGLVTLPHQGRTVRAFIESERAATRLDAELREQIGRAIHEGYRANQGGRKPPDDPAMAGWEDLPGDLRKSNREQADHIVSKLERLGWEIEAAESGSHSVNAFTAEEVELMAEWEHRRWNLERLMAGWTWGPERDVVRKRTPYLAAWPELPDEVREYDREAVRAIPEHLSAVGLQIARTARLESDARAGH